MLTVSDYGAVLHGTTAPFPHLSLTIFPVAQGKEVQQRIERQIAEAVAGSFVISLGGENGEDWGQCLAVQVSFLAIHRQQLAQWSSARVTVRTASHQRLCTVA